MSLVSGDAVISRTVSLGKIVCPITRRGSKAWLGPVTRRGRDEESSSLRMMTVWRVCVEWMTWLRVSILIGVFISIILVLSPRGAEPRIVAFHLSETIEGMLWRRSQR